MMTGGLFQCVEPIEARDAGCMLRRLEEAAPGDRVGVLLDFFEATASRTADALKAIRGLVSTEQAGDAIPEVRRAADVLRLVANGDGAGSMAHALEALAAIPGIKVFRRELLWAAINALRDANEKPDLGFRVALRRLRNQTSHIGRRLARCSVGSTLLVKGMEFDHAVVVHRGGPRGFTLNDLYVAVTRGARSLTVLSDTDTITRDALASS
jgi:DNA helicase-2/ATP-dependent DNA helicase PcrA